MVFSPFAVPLPLPVAHPPLQIDCRMNIKEDATASLALPSSSVGAPPVASPAQAHPPPPRTAAYPLWRTTTTTRRGV